MTLKFRMYVVHACCWCKAERNKINLIGGFCLCSEVEIGFEVLQSTLLYVFVVVLALSMHKVLIYIFLGTNHQKLTS